MTDNKIIQTCKNCLHYKACVTIYTNSFKNASMDLIDRVSSRWNECENFIDKDLINRLQAENKDKDILLNHQGEVIKTLEQACKEKLAEIDRLKEPRMVNIVHARCLGKTFSIYGALYQEAYKECIENVKKLRANYQGYDFDRELDNLLKEMVGDKNDG